MKSDTSFWCKSHGLVESLHDDATEWQLAIVQEPRGAFARCALQASSALAQEGGVVASKLVRSLCTSPHDGDWRVQLYVASMLCATTPPHFAEASELFLHAFQ